MRYNVLCLLALLPTAYGADYKERAEKTLQAMSKGDKLSILHGIPSVYVGKSNSVSEFNIPPLLMNDGPQGFRDMSTLMIGKGKTTAFPSGMTVAASFDRALAYKWGDAMANEFALKGSNVLLGPGLNVARVPTNGRNFEYLSGEDPYLGAALVGPVVQGIQSNGVIANAKHFAFNNQETNRGSCSSNVDERTRWEMYYPPFQAAVEAEVGSFMCSYNRVNGVHACENEEIISELKEGMGYEGWIMSDWYATHSTTNSAIAGLDQEMPTEIYFGPALTLAVNEGKVPMDVIDDKVRRVLRMMYKFGLVDNPRNGTIGNTVTSDAHNKLVRQIAAESTVLLKNENELLPLSPGATDLKKIAVVGSAAKDKPIIGGGGSGKVVPPYISTVVDGLSASVASTVSISYTATPTNDKQRSALDAAIKDADVVVAVVATTSAEGSDRPNLAFKKEEDDLVAQVAASGKPVIVIVVSPGAVIMPWADSVDAILATFMPGQEAGNAVADVIFGRVNPSARLPMTLPNVENEVNFTPEQYPGVKPKGGSFTEAVYSEKLLVGYRHYDFYDIVPKFPFGHGLSYTSFQYEQIAVEKDSSNNGNVYVTVVITNTGKYDGADVPQLYLGFPAEGVKSLVSGEYNEPVKQLKGFEKVFIKQGESKSVVFTLVPRDFSVWSDIAPVHAFAVVPGTFAIVVGSSSRDIRLMASVSI